MFKLIERKETENLLLHCAGSNANDNYWDVSLSQYPRCYQIHQAYQLPFYKDGPDVVTLLSESPLADIPENCKVTVVLEMTPLFPMSLLKDIHAWATRTIDQAKLERFDPVFVYDGDFESRITVIYHDAKPRRSFCSRINSQAKRLRDMDLRIARKLDEELNRNDQVGTLVEIDFGETYDMLMGNHLLWTDVANSTCSTTDIVKRFRPEMERTKLEFNINGLLLFFEVDRDFTTMGEVNNLKSRLKRLAGNADVLFNVRVRDSFIKTITCRAVLLGGPKYNVIGEVFEDFGEFGILLYRSEDKDRGHEIIAAFAHGEFSLSRYDWGDFERNSRGETSDYHYLDEQNTAKLFTALKVKRPDTLLRTIRRRFGSRRASNADLDFLAFCHKEGIEYKSDYYY